MGKIDFNLGCQLASYHKEDYPSTRMRPLPVRVIQALDTAVKETTKRNITVSNLTWVAFFLLLRPGEYCKGSTNTAQYPFSINEIPLFIVQQPYNITMASNAVLAQADFVSLLFTTQ